MSYDAKFTLCGLILFPCLLLVMWVTPIYSAPTTIKLNQVDIITDDKSQKVNISLKKQPAEKPWSVFRNGILQKKSVDYTEDTSARRISFNDSPITNGWKNLIKTRKLSVAHKNSGTYHWLRISGAGGFGKHELVFNSTDQKVTEYIEKDAVYVGPACKRQHADTLIWTCDKKHVSEGDKEMPFVGWVLIGICGFSMLIATLFTIRGPRGTYHGFFDHWFIKQLVFPFGVICNLVEAKMKKWNKSFEKVIKEWMK